MTFFTTFFTIFGLFARASFFLNAAIFRRAALCSLLPFLYFDIFALSFAICFSSFDSFFASFLAFAFCFLASRFARFPPFFTIFFTTFFTIFGLFAALSFFFSAAILRIAALCSLLPFLYFDIFFFSAAICFSSFDSFFASFLAFAFCFLPM